MTQWDPRIITYWAKTLSVDSSLLTTPRNVAVFRSDKKYDERLIVYHTNTHALVFAPKRLEASIQGGLQDLLNARTFLASSLPTAFPSLGLQFKWRDYIYYWTQPLAYVTPDESIRQLTSADKTLLDQLQSACTEQDRHMGEISITDPLVVGYFEGGALLGVASLLEKGDAIVDIGILTHPEYRGLKIAKRLTRDLRDRALAKGKLVQYMCDETNAASMRVAQAVGFETFLTEEGYTLPL